jgi:hypothetical protein
MGKHRTIELRALEGRHVSLSLSDGSRLDDVELVSAGRTDLRTIWVFAYGMDTFLPRAAVVDVWEAVAVQSDAA